MDAEQVTRMNNYVRIIFASYLPDLGSFSYLLCGGAVVILLDVLVVILDVGICIPVVEKDNRLPRNRTQYHFNTLLVV